MRLKDIIPPASHPYVAELRIDPADWFRLERIIDDARELRLLRLDDDQADEWCVYVGCASDCTQERLTDAWG